MPTRIVKNSQISIRIQKSLKVYANGSGNSLAMLEQLADSDNCGAKCVSTLRVNHIIEIYKIIPRKALAIKKYKIFIFKSLG